jgi:death on curing protein
LPPQTLSIQEIVDIHRVLVDDFAAHDDPISPVGVRDQGLLESAVNRQHTGFAGKLKYDTAVLSAATLCYGICCDHVFLNGNKRTALVAMLVHLDRNELCLPRTTQDELYNIMLAVADHKLGLRRKAARFGEGDDRPDPDDEVWELAKWLRKRVEPLVRAERPISYRQLRRILGNYGIHMENEGQNHMELVRYEEVRAGLFRQRRDKRRIRIATVGYRDEGTVIAKGDVRKLRRICKLDEENGVDSEMFYSTGEIIDSFVNRYRKVLRRLARK